MASIFGRELITSDEVRELREAAGELKLARREMEDLGWSLLNAPYEQNLGDIPPIDRNKAMVKGVKYWISDPLVGQAVDMYVDYVVGSGIPMPQADDDKLAEVLSRFWNDPENKLIITTMEAQQQKLAELQLFGNVFPVAFVNTGNGHVRLSDVAPREVIDIITDPENRKKHVFYKRQFVPTRYNFKSESYEPQTAQTTYYKSWRFRPDAPTDGTAAFGPDDKQLAGEDQFMFHWSIHRLSDGKFGNPRTLRIIEWVRAYNEFSKARVSIMRALAKFAWNRKIKGNGAQVQKIAGAGAVATADGNFMPPPPQYAATITTNEAVSYEALKTDTGGASAMQDGRLLKGQVGVGTGFPIHYLGDIGSANLATATSMELPVLKMIESMQGRLEAWIRDIIDFVIDNAIKYGDLPALDTGRFTAERVAERLRGVYNTDPIKSTDGEQLNEAGASDDGDRNKYEYRLNMPSILKRQVSETINAAVNVVKSIDPYSQNVEASRWLLEFTLEVMGVPNPKGISTKVFPDGFQYPTTGVDEDGDGEPDQVDAQRGRSDTLTGDGRGQPDFTKGRKPNSTSRTGQKGSKEARQPGEIATSVAEAEAALLDVIDTAMDHIEEARHGADPAAEATTDAT